MSVIDSAEEMLEIADRLITLTGFDAAACAHMSAVRMWRKSVQGRSWTPEFGRRIDAFTLRSLEVRERIRIAGNVFGRGERLSDDDTIGN